MYYFTYGSNLSKKQMKERCPDSKPMFAASLSNYKLVFVGWERRWRGGVASIKPLRGEKVLGAVYEVSERDLRQLDKYEDCPGNYTRLNVTVADEFGHQVEAVTYIKIKQLEETPPSGEYLSTIQQGYKDWGMVSA